MFHFWVGLFTDLAIDHKIGLLVDTTDNVQLGFKNDDHSHSESFALAILVKYRHP